MKLCEINCVQLETSSEEEMSYLVTNTNYDRQME
jgi:hypothetical protein